MGTDIELDVNELYAHLEATAELPIDHRTNRWIGEAEALAHDAATSNLGTETTKKRIRQIEHLLEEAGDTAHEDADRHLEASRELCRAILEE